MKIIVGIILGIGIIIGGALILGASGAGAPSITDIQNSVVKYAASAGAHDATCAYDASKWAPGYKFVCTVFNSSASEIGTVTVTAQTTTGNTANWVMQGN